LAASAPSALRARGRQARVRATGPPCQRAEDRAKSEGPAVIAGIGARAPLRKEAHLPKA